MSSRTSYGLSNWSRSVPSPLPPATTVPLPVSPAANLSTRWFMVSATRSSPAALRRIPFWALKPGLLKSVVPELAPSTHLVMLFRPFSETRMSPLVSRAMKLQFRSWFVGPPATFVLVAAPGSPFVT